MKFRDDVLTGFGHMKALYGGYGSSKEITWLATR